MKLLSRKFFLSFVVLSFLPFVFFLKAYAESYQCEILDVTGNVSVIDEKGAKRTVKEGDILNPNETVEVGKDSYADIAYDKNWKNISRIEADSRVTLRSIYPTKLEMSGGGVFAKLKALPKGSSFEVDTPTAIATVRGTEYRTTYKEGSPAEVFNFSDSEVHVFGIDREGHVSSISTTLHRSERTQVEKSGEPPKPPQKMTDAEIKKGDELGSAVDDAVKNAEKTGRVGRVQDVDEVEDFIKASSQKIQEDPEKVLQEMAKAYESKDLPAFMSRVSDDYPYRGEMEEFLRRDFRDYDGIKLNLFIKRIQNEKQESRVRADWDIQLFPTALTQQLNVKGSDLDFIFVNENGRLKLKAQRGANPLFGARSPDIASLSGASSSIARALETIEDTGTRASKQAALSLVGQPATSSSGESTPVNFQMSNAQVFNTGTNTTFPASSPPINVLKLQIDVRLADNAPVADLMGVNMEVTDSRTGTVLHGTGDLHAGQTTTIRTRDTITFGTIGLTGTFTYVLDPEHRFAVIDRTTARDVESYVSA